MDVFTEPIDYCHASPDGFTLLLGVGTTGMDETSRVAEMARLLAEALRRPITAPGSEVRAALVLSTFGDVDQAISVFAKKALQTLDDGNTHSTLLFSPGGAQAFAVSFVAWNGSHREVQAERIGNYVPMLYGTANRLVEMGAQLVGFLQIDAYVRMAGKTLLVDVEFSYLIGGAFGSSAPPPDEPQLRVIQINPELCTAEERRLLGLMDEG